MSRLDTITIAGYKSFAVPTPFELRPLTLLYGRNNAGKSALLRLLPVLASSVAPDASAPLVLSGRAGRDAHYREILWQGQGHRRLALTLRWKDGGHITATDRFILDFIDKIDQVVVRKLEILDPSEQPLLSMEAAPYPDHETYTIHIPGAEERKERLSFTGLIPDASSPDASLIGLEPLQMLVRRLESLRTSVLWLESTRVHPAGLSAKPNAPPRSLAPDGHDAAEVLLTSNDILREVGTWYRDALDRELEVKEVAQPYYRIILRPHTQSWDIDIAHTGEGMTQVLPVLVGAALARRRSHTYLAVEDPGSHLHPDAQKALAMHLAQLAATSDPPTVVIETHSRVLLLGIQLAVARGTIPPERVCAYWLDTEDDGSSRVTRSCFDERGKLTNWPRSALSEDLALARELLDHEFEEQA